MNKNTPTYAKVIFYIVAISYAIVAIFPFVWSIYTSLRPTQEAYKLTFDFSNLTLDAYKNLFEKNSIFRWYLNSIFIAVCTTIFGVLINTMMGYALARIKFPGRNVLFFVMIGVMMIPAQITMIPTYILLTRLNLINTYSGLILPFIFNAFNIFMMRQFFLSFPSSLEEAAEIDGLGKMATFFKIAMPLAKPAMTTIFILSFMGSWNNFLMPNLLITSRDMYTLPVGMASLNNQYFSFPNQTMAGAILLSAPMIIMFLFLQQYFIQGVSNSGMKD